ncbi:hypothetical protein KA977_14425 [Candidatus Dependentiae bacterium]|nr:hypothetical protein [Candidatus Dependentiae bacterium]
MYFIKAIVQARMGSTRLKNKSIIDFNGKPLITVIFSRLKLAKKINLIVLATSVNKEDDILAEYAENSGIKVIRGDAENVLSRFIEAEKKYFSDLSLRITGDNPLIAFDYLDNFIDFTIDNNLDYSSIKGLPLGLGAEIYVSKKLLEFYNENLEWYYKEHVTPYFYKNEKIYKIRHFNINYQWNDVRLTVDTKEDYIVVSKIYTELYNHLNREPSTNEIIDFCRKNEELTKLNSEIHQRKFDEKYF